MLSFISSTFFYSILIIIPSILIVLIHGDNIFEKKLFYFLYKKGLISDQIQKQAAEFGVEESWVITNKTGKHNRPTTPRVYGDFEYPSLKPDPLYEEKIKDLLQNQLEKLTTGHYLFNPPNEMKAGTKNRIVLRIGREINIDLKENLKGIGTPILERLKLSNRIQAYLFGNDFFVDPLNRKSQFLDDSNFTEWAWDVTPVKSGELELKLRISLRMRLPYGEEHKDYPIIENTIKVKPNSIYSAKIFLQENWKWVITALILPLIGWSVKMILG